LLQKFANETMNGGIAMLNPHKQDGITLIELLAALSLSTIVLGVVILLTSVFTNSFNLNFNSFLSKNNVRLVQETIENYSQKSKEIDFSLDSNSSASITFILFDDSQTTIYLDPSSGQVKIGSQVLTTLNKDGISFYQFINNTKITNTADPIVLDPSDSAISNKLILIQLQSSSNQNGQDSTFSSRFILQPVRQY
jgi:type II secretory pathway pseudopilin PulG